MPSELAIDFSSLSSLPSDVTFARTGSAWYFDDSDVLQSASSGSPRLGRTTPGGPRGLIIEGQRTNECLYSNDMTVSAWQTFSSSSITETANYAAGPDGTTTATRLEFTTSYGHIIQQNVTISGGTANKTITYSVWLKSNTGSSQVISLKNTHGGVADNFTDITVTTSWQRFQFTVNNNSSPGSGTHFVGLINRSTSTKDILAWHHQVEQASFASSPIPTTSSAVTRNADSAKIVAADASAYLDADNGAIVASFSLSGTAAASSIRVACSLNDTTTSEAHSLYASSGNAVYRIVDGGATQAEVNAGASAAVETLALLAGGYELNNVAAVLNNGTAVTDTSATMPAVTEIEFGSEAGAGHLFGVLEKFRYLPTRPSNSDLEILTADVPASTVTPGAASLVLTAFAPTVTVTEHVTVVPGFGELTLTPHAPTITATDHQVVEPGAGGLTLTPHVPTVVVTEDQFVRPGAAALTLTPHAPVVTVTDDKIVEPGAASLTLTPHAPTVVTTGNLTVVPGYGELMLVAFAPTIFVGDNLSFEPGAATLTLIAYPPSVATDPVAVVTLASWDPRDIIEAGDEWRLILSGPSADAPRVRIVLRFQKP